MLLRWGELGFEVAPQVLQAIGGDPRPLPGLGQDEGALEHRLDMEREALCAPRRIGNEVLKGLIRPRIADALEHRAHGLPTTVAQQPEQIPSERAPLRHVREADLEDRVFVDQVAEADGACFLVNLFASVFAFPSSTPRFESVLSSCDDPPSIGRLSAIDRSVPRSMPAGFAPLGSRS